MVLQVTAEQQDALQCCRMLRRTAPYTAVRWCGVAKSDAHAKSATCCPNHEMMQCLQEFERLEDASGVFKLIGPVLIRQDPIEVGARHAKQHGVLMC